MTYPASLKLPADLHERLALGTKRSAWLEPDDIVTVLARPDEFTSGDVAFCRANAWSALEWAALVKPA